MYCKWWLLISVCVWLILLLYIDTEAIAAFSISSISIYWPVDCDTSIYSELTLFWCDDFLVDDTVLMAIEVLTILFDDD